MTRTTYSVIEGEGQVVAVALHAGHSIRNELQDLFAVTEADRLREEDPGTDLLTAVGDTRIISHVSRFETDLNRPRTKAVYLEPGDAWRLSVWKDKLPEAVIARSLEVHDSFYQTAAQVLGKVQERCGRFLVLDLHSYNHRRGGPDAPPADISGNPDIDVETTDETRVRWAPIVDCLVEKLRNYPFEGRRLDVRENVRFQAGHFNRWAGQHFASCCVISIEVRKFYMDEWTGVIENHSLVHVRDALQSTIPGMLHELNA